MLATRRWPEAGARGAKRPRPAKSPPPGRLNSTGEELQRAQEMYQKIVRMYPLRKLGSPEDLGNMIAFLASEKANHITGQTVSVNGGYCMP